jgi:hypothetical protein
VSSQELGSGLHPSIETLALFSASDLRLAVRWRVRRHVSRCSDCQQHVTQLRAAKVELRREAATQTLTGFEAIADWGRIEREMLGNIAVGVAAARCIDNVGRKRALVSRAVLVTALITLFVIGWMTHIPQEQRQHLGESLAQAFGLRHSVPDGTILRSTPDGITVRAQGATLTILNPNSAVFSVSGHSGVAARYVDDESGQVTITKVYAQ